MTIIESLISGVVQGLTEFLPISSSGHLVLVHTIFGQKEPDIFFDVCLHFATLIAVVLYFRNDIVDIIKNRNIKLCFFLAAATSPAVLAALFFEDIITSFFSEPLNVAFMFGVTAVVLLVGQFALSYKPGTGKDIKFRDAMIVGIAQAFALVPGISRSGTTVSCGLILGIEKEKAFKFAFLLSIPAVLGAMVYKGSGVNFSEFSRSDVLLYSGGMLVAFVTGILSLRLLWWIIRMKRLYIFSIYCFLLSLSCIFLIK